MSEDITDLKKMEADLVAKDAALAHASTEKAISALVAGLSHDINNALGGITGGQDLTKMYLSKNERTLAKIDTARLELVKTLRAGEERVAESTNATFVFPRARTVKPTGGQFVLLGLGSAWASRRTWYSP